MALTEFELIMLEDGGVALQRVGADKPLVRVSFSSSVLDYLGDNHVDVAKSMIDAGIQTLFEINQEKAAASEESSEKQHTLH